MNIISGGCSLVWGNELEDFSGIGPDMYSKHTFPALLTKQAGAEYLCTARPGNSNSQIAQDVKTALTHYTCNVGVIVLWTWPLRDNKLESDAEIQDLQNYLDKNQIPYLFSCVDNCVVTKKLNYSNWFLFPSTRSPFWPIGFYQWAVENKYKQGPQTHPLEQAHLDASILMQEKFNELVTKHLQQN